MLTHAGLAEPGTPKHDAKHEWIWALLGFSALAVFWTWPVAANLNSRIPHDAGDPVLNIWILWWNAQATPLTDAWWNAPMMWPVPGSMALSEHLLGLSIVATPLQLLGAGPIAAYNVCLLLTYALSGFFAYLLGKRLTGSTFAGICAGIAFGFSPYRASQLAHIQVLSSQWMPLALLGLHAYLETGARRWLVVFGLAWLLQALSNGYFLLFFPVLIGAWLLWFVDWRRAPRRGLEIVAAGAIASLPLLPVLLKYHEVHEQMGLSRSVTAIRVFSASAASFFHAAPMLRFWREGPVLTHEQYLFTGLMVVVLAAIGLLLAFYPRTRRDLLANRAPIVFYSLATLLMCVLALGPGGKGFEPPSPFRPYTWLLVLPGYNGLRVPARFYMVGSLCLAIAASLAVGYLAKLAVGAGRIRVAGGKFDRCRSAGGRDDARCSSRSRSRAGDPADDAAGCRPGAPARRRRRQHSLDVPIDLSRAAARQRLLGPLSAPLRRVVAVAMAWRYVAPLLLCAATPARHLRRRSGQTRSQLQEADRGSAGDTVARREQRRLDLSLASAAGTAGTASRCAAPVYGT